MKEGNLHFPLGLIPYQTCFSVLISFSSSPNFPSPGDLAPKKFLELKRGCIFFFGPVVCSQSLTGGDGPKDGSGTAAGGQSIPYLPAWSGCFSCKCLVWHEGMHKALLKVRSHQSFWLLVINDQEETSWGFLALFPPSVPGNSVSGTLEGMGHSFVGCITWERSKNRAEMQNLGVP